MKSFLFYWRNFIYILKRRDNYMLDTHFSASLGTEFLYDRNDFTLLKVRYLIPEVVFMNLVPSWRIINKTRSLKQQRTFTRRWEETNTMREKDNVTVFVYRLLKGKRTDKQACECVSAFLN